MFIAGVYSALGERSMAKLLYVQAFVGVATIPLTYILARRFTGIIPALVAAGIVAVDDLLIDHARYMYAEIVYTPLLLVALLALLWALQEPRPWRFAVAGASMALVTLCRPTSALLPLVLPLLLPWGWHLKQKARRLRSIWPRHGGGHRAVDLPQLAHISPLPAVEHLSRRPVAGKSGVLSPEATSAEHGTISGPMSSTRSAMAVMTRTRSRAIGTSPSAGSNRSGLSRWCTPFTR